MLSSQKLPAPLTEALRSGRAIPFLVDHRHEKMPDCTLTVIGLIDTRSFEGVFLPDGDHADDGLVRVSLPDPSVVMTTIRSDCTDAQAVHELWSLWIGGVVDQYMEFVNALALSTSIARMNAALENAVPVDSPKPRRRTPEPRAKGSGKRRAAAKASRTRK